MPDAWDTTVASRMHGDGRHASLLDAHVRARVPVTLPAPAVQEIARGIALHSARKPGTSPLHDRLAEILAHPLVEVLPLGAAAAVLAGKLLALLPHPPTGPHRRHGTRAHQRAAWALDVQIASCAFAGGYGVLTENVADFAVLRDAIERLVPDVPPLVVSDAREPAPATA